MAELQEVQITEEKPLLPGQTPEAAKINLASSHCFNSGICRKSFRTSCGFMWMPLEWKRGLLCSLWDISTHLWTSLQT
uniref:NDRG family member 2 n=1 Tax=Prolemur simus TaxID=1328070 RepID=A0A8C9DKY6_PROSS